MPSIMYKTVADRLENCSKVILVHGNADMDAIGSAYALALAFGDATIYAPNGIDRVAKMVADKMHYLFYWSYCPIVLMGIITHLLSPILAPLLSTPICC